MKGAILPPFPLLLALALLLPAGQPEAKAQEVAQETYQYARRDSITLYLDIYRPPQEADTTFQGMPKPTVLFVFGGGFAKGTRDWEGYLPWFRRLLENGYPVVSIDYRLGMRGQEMGKSVGERLMAAKNFYLSQEMAVEDFFSAIAFLRENARELHVDTENLVAAGSSAGAITVLEASRKISCGEVPAPLPGDFQLKGVMSFAGGVISVKGAPLYRDAPCPTLLLHGTADQAVPYKKKNVLGNGVWGSDYLAALFAKADWNYCIYRFKDRTHDVAAYMDYLWEAEQAFLERNVILGQKRIVDAVVDNPDLPTWGNLKLEDIYK